MNGLTPAPITAFADPDYARLHYHWVCKTTLGLCGTAPCEQCAIVHDIVTYATGWMLYTLFENYRRYSSGSDVVALHQGDMSYVAAKQLLRATPRVSNQRESILRLERVLERDFENIDISTALGVDAPLTAYAAYVPFLESDTLYTTLRTLYASALGNGPAQSTTNVPYETVSAFITICFHSSALLNINVNSVKQLWSYSLLSDTVLLHRGYSERLRPATE